MSHDHSHPGKWFGAALRSIGDAVIATDPEGRVTFINRVAELLTGWSEGEAVGRPLPEVFAISGGSAPEPVESIVKRVLREGITISFPEAPLLLSCGGVELPVEGSLAPISDGTGRIIGVVLVVRDATERSRAETEWFRLWVEERAARLHAERAAQAKD